jgi:hypothetical protein
MPETYIQYNPDTSRVIVFGPGGLADLPIPLADARLLAGVLDVPIKIVGQNLLPTGDV